MSDRKKIDQQTFRAAALAGIFYPGEDFLIRSALQGFGLIQNPRINARCILSPHGSWHLLGNAHVAAYKSLLEWNDADEKPRSAKTVSKVVLLGCRHHIDEAGLFLSESDYFETPVGNLMIDKEINDALMSCNTLFELNDIPYLQEDVLETHFPFIKYLFPEASFVPILTGGYDQKTMNSLASALNIVFEPIIDETLFVISSNSSNHADSRVSKMQFERFKSLVQEKNGIKLLDDYKANNMSACGIVSIAAMLESGLLDKSAAVQVPYSDASIIDVDGKTVCFTALNFSEKADPLESFMDRRQGDRRKPGH